MGKRSVLFLIFIAHFSRMLDQLVWCSLTSRESQFLILLSFNVCTWQKVSGFGAMELMQFQVSEAFL